MTSLTFSPKRGETPHQEPWFPLQLWSIPHYVLSTPLLDLFPAGASTDHGIWAQWLLPFWWVWTRHKVIGSGHGRRSNGEEEKQEVESSEEQWRSRGPPDGEGACQVASLTGPAHQQAQQAPARRGEQLEMETETPTWSLVEFEIWFWALDVLFSSCCAFNYQNYCLKKCKSIT